MGTIAQKLEYLNDTRLLLKDNINKINNVLDDDSTFRSYPQELFNGYLDVLNNGTDTLWNNLEKVSASGEEATLENVETAPMKMVLNGNTSQDGEPTPDTPVEVKVVKGENVVSVSGKNLFDKDNQAKIQVNAEGTLRYGIIVDAPNKKVSISAKTWGQAVAYKTLIGGVYGQYSTIQRNSTFEIEEKIIIYNALSDIQLLDNNIEDLQIEISDSPTNYVPYSKTDYPISLGTIEMCKIGDYKDYFHKDSGKWYVHKEIGKKVVDENSSVAAYSVPRFRVYVANFVSPSATEKADILCDKLRTVTKNALASTDNVISGSDSGRTGEMLVRINAEINTLELFKQFLAEHNLTIYYLLATPTEEEITNTTLISQLEAIYKAKSVKDKTYITQTNDELPFILDVEAIKEYEVN